MAAGVLALIASAAQAASPSLLASPVGQSVRRNVTLSGSGFAPNSPVTFSFDGAPLKTSSPAVTDSSGSISDVTFAVPGSAAVGTHTISGSDGTNTASVQLAVDSVSATPSTGVPGTGLEVTGSGWTPGDPVGIYVAGVLSCQLIADASGNISGTQAGNGCAVPAVGVVGERALAATDLTNGAQARGADITIPLVAQFTTNSPVGTGSPVTFTSTSVGTPSSYLWEFGDGQQAAGGATVSHAYAEAGTYTVTLIVSDASGDVAQSTRQVNVEGPPSAQFVMSPTTPEPTGTPIQFDGTGSNDPNGTIAQYQWSFGDGQTSTLPTPIHAYAVAGSYTVTLTVTDALGNTSSTSQQVLATDRPPIAAFNPTAATVLAGSNVAFDGTPSSDPDGSITGYAWSFGDGTSSTSAQPTHTYLNTGTFTVTLTVTDNSGNIATVAHQIIVIAPPPTQTLILTPLANPTIVRWLPVSTRRTGAVDLGQRLFCPGTGPPCTATITATSRSLARGGGATGVTQPGAGPAGARVIRVAPNGSAELAFHLSRRALAVVRRVKRLRIRLKIVVVRGAQSSTSISKLTLR